ncbi:hypothetical protein NSQ26_11090 [Bacillus sp. FSL W7-1360]
MKKPMVIASHVILLGSIVYLIFQLTRSPLYLPDIYAEPENPVSFQGSSIDIDTHVFQSENEETGVLESESESIYSFSLDLFYLLIILSMTLFGLSFVKKRKDRS